MFIKNLKTILLTPIIVLFISSAVRSQEVGSIQATATVVSTLSISGTQNLDFATVTPGIVKSVDKSTVGSAGEFSLSGVANSEVSLNFTLPSDLMAGASNMPISFTGLDCSWDDGSGGGQSSPSGAIDPRISNNLRLGAGGALTVWLGGTVTPSVAQTGGSYTADVILTVAYTGG